MSRLRALFALILALLIAACSQTPKDVQTANLTSQFGTSEEDIAYDVAATNNAVYVLGVSGDQGAAFGSDLGHVFLKRFDRSGNLTWTRKQEYGDGGCIQDACYFRLAGTDTDAHGNAYGAYGAPSKSIVGGSDAFVMKYDRYGVLRWKRQLEPLEKDDQAMSIDATGMAVDGQGNSYIVSLYYVVPEEDESPVDRTLFSKYGAGGKLLWQQEISPAARRVGVAIADDMVYVAGGPELAKYGSDGSLKWSRTVNANLSNVAVNGSDEIYMVGSRGTNEIALYKYGRNGGRWWSKSISIGYRTWVNDIATDSAGSIYLTGETRPNATSSADIFTRKYNRNGGLVWSRRIGSPTTRDEANGIAVLSSSESYLVGSTNGPVNGQYQGGFYDAFLLRLNGQGKKVWSR